jgi:hypothetical protein
MYHMPWRRQQLLKLSGTRKFKALLSTGPAPSLGPQNHLYAADWASAGLPVAFWEIISCRFMGL